MERCYMMRKTLRINSDNISLTNDNNAPRIILLSAFFFAGCVLGAFFGTNFSAAVISESAFFGFGSDNGSLFLDIAVFLWLHVLVVFLGTTFLGLVLIPVSAMLKGFIFSCTSATIISLSASNGIIMALISVGIPSLFAIPVFMALCDNAFFRAGRLLALSRGDHGALMRRSDGRILLCIPVLALAYIAQLKLVPYLISHIS